MTCRTVSIALRVIASFSLFLCSTAFGAIVATPFPTNGAGGFVSDQILTIGSDGSVFEFDGFVNIQGLDLSGPGPGTSAQLGLDTPLPAGLDFSYNAAISADQSDLLLSYTFANNTGADILDFRFLAFLDAEIGAAANDFATTTGSLASNQNFQVGDPFGSPPSIFDNLLVGVLDGVNHIGPGTVGDVGMALSWEIGNLVDMAVATFDVLISEDGDSIGGFSISQEDEDQDPESAIITYSGDFQITTTVAAPSVLALLALGWIAMMRKLGSQGAAPESR